MLVAPLRVVKRFTELTKLETADLFEVAKHVGEAIEKQFNATSLTVAIQDGADAGQTVEHVHVHILPRKKGDFKRNDDVYEKLQSHDKDADGEPLPANSGLWRSVETMADEAAHMRKYFTSTSR